MAIEIGMSSRNPEKAVCATNVLITLDCQQLRWQQKIPQRKERHEAHHSDGEAEDDPFGLLALSMGRDAAIAIDLRGDRSQDRAEEEENTPVEGLLYMRWPK